MEEKIIIKGEPVFGVKLIYNAWLFSSLSSAFFGILVLLFIGNEVVLVALFISLALMIILSILRLIVGCYTINVTSKRVYGTAIFDRRVDLPLDSISSIGKVWFSGVSVSTASGSIKFYGMKNFNELYDEISKLLLDRQDKNNKQEIKVVQEKENVTEEIRKFKALLDDGIITNKEFEEKKKELLNLK